jgi:glyoxylase-like metal-dependent hydrolase (beta-lactamase superfamily II)
VDVTRLRDDERRGRTIGIDVSAYVVRGVMIDTGFVHAFEPLLRAVRGLNVRGAVVTHWHEDHAGNVASLASLGTPVLLRADTEATLRSFPRIELYRRAVWGTPSSVSSPIRAPELEGLVCVHTPGHSSDHQIVWDASTRTAFTGDLWLGVRARTVHATEDPYAIVESLCALRDLGPERMFDAHRGLVAPAIDAARSQDRLAIGPPSRRSNQEFEAGMRTRRSSVASSAARISRRSCRAAATPVAISFAPCVAESPASVEGRDHGASPDRGRFQQLDTGQLGNRTGHQTGSCFLNCWSRSLAPMLAPVAFPVQS